MPSQWPKACSCGASYSRAKWRNLCLRGYQSSEEEGRHFLLELRDCRACRSTIGVESTLTAEELAEQMVTSVEILAPLLRRFPGAEVQLANAAPREVVAAVASLLESEVREQDARHSLGAHRIWATGGEVDGVRVHIQGSREIGKSETESEAKP